MEFGSVVFCQFLLPDPVEFSAKWVFFECILTCKLSLNAGVRETAILYN